MPNVIPGADLGLNLAAGFSPCTTSGRRTTLYPTFTKRANAMARVGSRLLQGASVKTLKPLRIRHCTSPLHTVYIKLLVNINDGRTKCLGHSYYKIAVLYTFRCTICKSINSPLNSKTPKRKHLKTFALFYSVANCAAHLRQFRILRTTLNITNDHFTERKSTQTFKNVAYL